MNWWNLENVTQEQTQYMSWTICKVYLQKCDLKQEQKQETETGDLELRKVKTLGSQVTTKGNRRNWWLEADSDGLKTLLLIAPG